ncbi:peptidylprolyl isomerase [Thiomonas sp.]|uniref:peptidylprolyl isomerase n=1 Tax=Thiomonas sp. TaxID=2047785 RepID=UPI00262FD791|nr:peptidylprolyl isomerase [Thiomonas sp.]
MDAHPHQAAESIDGALQRLRLRAAELGLQAGSEEDLLEAVLRHDLQIPEPSLDECRRYYAQHGAALRQGDIIEAEHILFAITPATPIDALRARAEATLRDLMLDPGRFGTVAQEMSNCPSAQVGGNLGQLTAEQCVPEFWQAMIEHNQPGLLPRLVRSRFGLHIVRISRIVRGTLPPFDAVSPHIAQRLRQQSLVRALQLYAQDLLAQDRSGEEAAALACPAPGQ